MVDCVYEFRNKKIKQHLGGIYDFLQKKKMDTLKELEISAKNKKPANNSHENIKVQVKGINFEDRKEINRTISRLEKQVVETEMSIESLESEIKKMDGILSAPDKLVDQEIFGRYVEFKNKLARTMEKWEVEHEELEKWKSKKTW